jgi:hypothetical protein
MNRITSLHPRARQLVTYLICGSLFCSIAGWASYAIATSMVCGEFAGTDNSVCPTNCVDIPGGSCKYQGETHKRCQAGGLWSTCNNSLLHCPGHSNASPCPNALPRVLNTISCPAATAGCPYP